jgi:RNA polymerase sigma factor for flagellar operon FliA
MAIIYSWRDHLVRAYALGITVAIEKCVATVGQPRKAAGKQQEPKMNAHALQTEDQTRIVKTLPFVEALARRMAATMPHSIDIGDLVQDGVIGLIDAAKRFDEGRGIKFETFAERRVRGAMIDALRREAWPRGVRRVRRELEAAREELRRTMGCEPSVADLAAKVGSDEKRLSRTIVRINTIESTSPHSSAESTDDVNLPAALVPSEPESPSRAFEANETRERVRAAIASLPWRERKVVGMYYYGDVTMKDIGASIGVNESRVSQLHTRAIQRLRVALGSEADPKSAGRILREAVVAFQQKPKMLKAQLATQPTAVATSPKQREQMVANWTRMPLAMAAEKPRARAARR